MARFNSKEIERGVKQIERAKVIWKIIPICLSSLGTLLVLTYLVSLMYSKVGSFTISVNKYQHTEYGISLSESREFKNPTTNLTCKAASEITNIKGESLGQLDLGAIDGVDNGDNYLCYTFYLKNTGSKSLALEESLVISKMSLDIEKAVRVKVIKKLNNEDATSTIYARARGVENGVAIPEDDCDKMFYAKNIISYDNTQVLNPGDIIKYTIILWLEGPDPDCNDDIIGGEFKIDMKFNILGAYTIDD